MNIEEERLKVCAAARSYAGVPWVGQGRNRLGVDCSGLIIMAFRDAGYQVDEPRPDYRGVDSVRMLQVLLRHCVKLPADAQLYPADVVVYGTTSDVHNALLLDGKPLNAIHCPYEGRVVEARFDITRSKIRGFYRWRQFYSYSR